jgi:hypothetical protein
MNACSCGWQVQLCALSCQEKCNDRRTKTAPWISLKREAALPLILPIATQQQTNLWENGKEKSPGSTPPGTRTCLSR